MIFHRFRRPLGRSDRSLRPAEPPANPSPRPHTGELGRSELADETFDMAVGNISRASLPGVSSSCHHVWNTAQRTIATRLLERALDPDEIRQLQHDVLVPLELDLIARSREEPLTFAQVTTTILDALDHHHLDR